MLFVEPTRAVSDATNRVLANGAVTNTLCVHYLAYHRAEVPVAELDAVWQLPAAADVPSLEELGAPDYRLPRKPVDSVIWRLNEPIQEEVDEEKAALRWWRDRHRTSGTRPYDSRKSPEEHGGS